jgi:Protein of unknown function (DUF3105)
VSKASRRQQRQAKTSGATPRPLGTPAAADAEPARPTPRPSSSPTGTPRAGRRPRVRASYEPSTFERYRGLIIGIAAVAAIVVVGGFVFLSASAPAYACSNLFDPAPTASPAPGASPQPGYPQPDMGRLHVATGSEVTYTYCPPASGNHYNAAAVGPIAPRFYSVNDKTVPEGWIHNLEHGGMVLLYRGDGPGATPDGQAQLKAFFASFPPSPVCGFAAGTQFSPVIAEFNDMKTPFAALVWGRALPLQTFDAAAILQFNATYAERTNPESFCASPTPIPTASPSASASGSAGTSASPSASASSVPSSSASAPASASPVASPSASPSPSPS